MNKNKRNNWLTRPWMPGLLTFLLLASVCLYAIWSLSDCKSIAVITLLCVFAFILSLIGGLFAASAANTSARLQQLLIERTAELRRDIAERKTTENELLESVEHLRQLSHYIENIREKERLNTAKEIHEELGQQLTILKMDVSGLGRKRTAVEDTLAVDINAAVESINKMIKTVRKISSELRPGILDDIGLAAALDWYCHDFSKRTGIKTSFITDTDDNKFPEKLNINIFRIIQESLTNVAKHSGARQANVSLIYRDNQLLLLIEDNGKGFDLSMIDNSKKPGILIMKERAMMINGTLNVNSTPGNGTIIEVRVPLNKPAIE